MATYENNNNQLTGRLLPHTLLHQHYLIASLAGRGGMSAVYKGVDTQQGNRNVAIKEMSQGFLGEEERNAAIASIPARISNTQESSPSQPATHL